MSDLFTANVRQPDGTVVEYVNRTVVSTDGGGSLLLAHNEESFTILAPGTWEEVTTTRQEQGYKVVSDD